LRNFAVKETGSKALSWNSLKSSSFVHPLGVVLRALPPDAVAERARKLVDAIQGIGLQSPTDSFSVKLNDRVKAPYGQTFILKNRTGTIESSNFPGYRLLVGKVILIS
jgi:hypothetical protein